MYFHYYQFPPLHPYAANPYQGQYYGAHPYFTDDRNYFGYSYGFERQQSVRGQATWTEGGEVTKCGIPWSTNDYMTAAVGEDSPYQCGQMLRVKNLSDPDKEVTVMVVDETRGYPPNKINLHRNAFEALGANLDVGVLNVEITPVEESESDFDNGRWGDYLSVITQTAFPSYYVTNFRAVGKTPLNPHQTKETYNLLLQSPQEAKQVRGNVVYHTNTNQVIAFDIQEL
ncbi:DUF3889 domain-containing protein [Alteribacillus sp. JSM 102045]|uniref:DUF3889 domain-containing protein n=1 Tax=Alteribacillus sp. JSM 102045 TaxID=1562101 RepID=UPI0035BF6D9C